MRASSRSICRRAFSWYGRYRSRAPASVARQRKENCDSPSGTG